MPVLMIGGDNRLDDMRLDKKQFSSGIVGAAIGACSVAGINALSSATHKSKATMYERVETVADGDVFITPKGKKFHRGGCYILKQSDEVKRASRSDVMDIGYEPCRKCRP